MSRNRMATALQKTYDDSYLSCSTAVFYEGQVSCNGTRPPQDPAVVKTRERVIFREFCAEQLFG